MPMLGEINTQKVGKVAVLGAVMALVAQGISFGISKIPPVKVVFSAITLDVRSKLESGIGGEVGKTLLNFLNVKMSIPDLLLVAISGAAIAIVGYLIFSLAKDMLPQQLKESTGRKLATLLVFGSIAFSYGLQVWKGIPALGTLVVLIVYSLILSWVTVELSKRIDLIQIPEL